MNRYLLLLAMLPLVVALGATGAPGQKEIYLGLSLKETLKYQDWSGGAEISAGKIIRVEKDSGATDTLHPDGSWEIVYGRSLLGTPGVLPPTARKGVLLVVEAPDDAVITVRTKGGEFTFRVGDVTAAGIERLGGNVRVSLGRPAEMATGGGGRTGARQQRRQQADDGHGTPRVNLPAATIAGEIPAERVSDPAQQSDWPSVAVASDGAVWSTWVEWNGKDADRVLVRRRAPGGAWGAPIALNDGGWGHYMPAIAAAGTGVVVAWSGQKEGNYDLYAATVDAAGRAGAVEPLTRAPHGDFNARMAGRDGNVTLVWQSFRDGQSDVYARQYRAGAWGPEVRVSPGAFNDWDPEVAVDARSRAWISWDGYENGNYDVFLRSLENGRMGEVVRVTSDPTAQFHSSVAVDREGRVWVAWDDAGENWGLDFSAASSMPGSRGLHFSRSLGIRVYDNGRLRAPAADLGKALTGRMQRYAELPHLGVDGAGTLWMVFRHWTGTQPCEVFDFYATRLDGDGWSTPWRLANSSGQNSQRAGLALGADGRLLAAYASDGRGPGVKPESQMHSLHFQAYVAALEKGPGAGGIALADVKLPPPGKAPARRQRAVMSAGRAQYTLLYGDCHRHTDIRGHSGVDGSILDTYRYARDPAQLDFLGTADHNEAVGGRWADGLRDYSWWWTQKAVDLFTCAPHFIGVYTYEHSMNRPGGHRNILFARRGAPLRPIDRERNKDDNQPPNLWKWMEANVFNEPAQKAVIVPHTFAAGPLADWDWPNPRFDGVLEIYQGCRGSYEAFNQPKGEKRGGTQTNQPGHFAQDALAKGNKYGFVSFSDHNSTHNSWAGVWAQEPTRDGILDGMLARRTFAATDEIVLSVTADGHAPGEEFRAKTAPTLRINAAAPDTILRVDIIKDGKFLWSGRPNQREFQTTFKDAYTKPGACYYYVRLLQRDPEKPDGDPEMAWSSPFFVTYE